MRAAFKELIQLQRKHLRDAQKAHRDRLRAADKLSLSLRRESDLIVRAYCVANGSRLQAGRRVVSNANKHDTAGPCTEELRELIERAQHGDETALPELRQILDDTPELWQQVGDLARHVETAWIKLLAGHDLLTQESLRREAERRRTELLGHHPTSIEKHLVERIVATWLQLQHAEIQMGNSQEATEQRLNFLHKRLESAQKQHAAAINQLVKIRTLTGGQERQKPKRDKSKSGCDKPRRPRHRVIAA